METLEELLEKNKNLIYSLANCFNGNKDDLFQVGVIGFINAYNNYKPTEGIKFTTYAYKYIWGEMKKFTREDKTIKINRSIESLNRKIEEAYNFLTQKLMREPSIKELSMFTEIEEHYIEEALMSRNGIKSLDDTVGNDENLLVYEVISSKDSLSIEDLVIMREALASLDEDEKYLIESRYLQDKTQSEVSNMLGTNQVQVSRREQKVLEKLKHYMAA